MPYRLIMEVQDEQNLEEAQREFESMEDAKAYAHQQVNGDIYWTVRDGYWDGLAPGYALRIESVEPG